MVERDPLKNRGAVPLPALRIPLPSALPPWGGYDFIYSYDFISFLFGVSNPQHEAMRIPWDDPEQRPQRPNPNRLFFGEEG